MAAPVIKGVLVFVETTDQAGTKINKTFKVDFNAAGEPQSPVESNVTFDKYAGGAKVSKAVKAAVKSAVKQTKKK